MTDYCFFTAFSQTDAHFDPDTADNPKQRNRKHQSTIPSYLGTFMFDGFSHISDCCRFRCRDIVF